MKYECGLTIEELERFSRFSKWVDVCKNKDEMQVMVGRFKVITLCGSVKFKDIKMLIALSYELVDNKQALQILENCVIILTNFRGVFL